MHGDLTGVPPRQSASPPCSPGPRQTGWAPSLPIPGSFSSSPGGKSGRAGVGTLAISSADALQAVSEADALLAHPPSRPERTDPSCLGREVSPAHTPGSLGSLRAGPGSPSSVPSQLSLAQSPAHAAREVPPWTAVCCETFLKVNSKAPGAGATGGRHLAALSLGQSTPPSGCAWPLVGGGHPGCRSHPACSGSQ